MPLITYNDLRVIIVPQLIFVVHNNLKVDNMIYGCYDTVNNVLTSKYILHIKNDQLQIEHPKK